MPKFTEMAFHHIETHCGRLYFLNKNHTLHPTVFHHDCAWLLYTDVLSPADSRTLFLLMLLLLEDDN